MLIGDPPTASVAKSLNLPHSTAARWVAKAREKRFLGPPERQGKAGERGTKRRK
jgi:hypothetical protein